MLTRPEGSVCPGPRTRGGVLVMVFPPGLYQPPPWDQPTVLPPAVSVPAYQHRHCPPGRSFASEESDAWEAGLHAGVSASGHFWLQIPTAPGRGRPPRSGQCLTAPPRTRDTWANSVIWLTKRSTWPAGRDAMPERGQCRRGRRPGLGGALAD